MATILYMEISKDGFIAGPNDETPWSDAAWESYENFIRTCDVVVVGRRTFELMQVEDEFMEGIPYIVATSDDVFDAGDYITKDIRSAADMPVADRVGIIGGGELNGRLASLGVIDEMILDIEPIELHEGIRLFGNYNIALKLEMLGSRQIGETTIQRHYKIVR